MQTLCGLLGLFYTSLLEVDVDQEREQRTLHAGRAHGRNFVVGSLGGPFEQVPCQRNVAACEMECGEDPYRVRMLLQTLEQLPSLLQSTLPDAQVGQPDDRGSTSLRHALVKVSSGVNELYLGLLPASGSGQDAPIVCAAECGDGVSAGHHLRRSTYPLVRARDIVDQFARPEEPAEQVVHGYDLGQLAGTQCRH